MIPSSVVGRSRKDHESRRTSERGAVRKLGYEIRIFLWGGLRLKIWLIWPVFRGLASMISTEGSNPDLSATRSALQRKLRCFCRRLLGSTAICEIFAKCELRRIVPSDCAAVVSGPFSLNLVFAVRFARVQTEQRHVAEGGTLPTDAAVGAPVSLARPAWIRASFPIRIYDHER